MFNNSYTFFYVDRIRIKEKDIFFIRHKLAFTCRFNHRYIVDVEEYDNSMFVIKFYLKSHSGSDNKYKLRTRFYDANRVVMTCIRIMLSFYSKNPYSSFGFIGANDIEESETDTKRYIFYKKLMENFFSPVKFQHLEYKKKSAYLLLNRDNSEKELKRKIEELFIKYYPDTFSSNS